jgi:hypothetical protein
MKYAPIRAKVLIPIMPPNIIGLFQTYFSLYISCARASNKVKISNSEPQENARTTAKKVN